jgi:hypothetical protein
VRVRETPDTRWTTLALFVPIGGVIWLCHVYAWGVLSVMAGGYEVARAWREGGGGGAMRLPRAFWRAIVRCWPLMLPLVIMPLWRENGEGAVTLGWFWFANKAAGLANTLRDQSKPLDLLSLGLLMALILAGLRDRRLRFDMRLGTAALFFLILAILIPYQLFGSAYADSRLWPIVLACGVLAVSVKPAHIRLEKWLAGLAVLLLAVRLCFGAVGFARYDSDYKSHLRALDQVEMGSRVAVFINACNRPWRFNRTDHLGSMALTRRLAFVNTQWDVPGAQLLRMKGAPGSRYNADPSQFVHAGGRCVADMRAALGQRIADFPRDRFQYVWLFGFNPASLPAYPGLRRLYHDSGSVLYAVAGGIGK